MTLADRGNSPALNVRRTHSAMATMTGAFLDVQENKTKMPPR
jgi:hypothetical protein